MAPEIITTQPATIRAYFEKVRQLAKDGNEFPIDLDEVWPLVYTEKGKAVRALRKEFIEGVDFQSFAQNGKREIGATIIHVYRLTVPCLEFFIARKVREVFDVYRQVFHKVADQSYILSQRRA